MFGDDERTEVCLYDNRGYNFIDVEFTPTDAVFDSRIGGHIVAANKLKISYYGEDDEEYKESVKAAKSSKIEQFVIYRKMDKAIHYAV